jgi:sugar/nucleoside kinase (ribokinase family)
MAEARYDVVCIGDAIVDLLATTDDDFIAAEGLAKGTTALIDADRAKALYTRMGHAVEVAGGSAANTAAGLASLGGQPAYIGKVGDDALGKIFTHELSVAGVDVHIGVAEGSRLPTAMCLVLITPDAQRTMNTYLGACVELGPEDIDEATVAAGNVTYIEGYQWDMPQAKAAIRKASRAARAADRKVAWSLSDPFVVDRHKAELKDLLHDGIDILFGNEEEVLRLTDSATLAAAIPALKSANVLAAITLGAKGAIVIDGETVAEVPAVPVAKVIDTTGAGDLFASGFLYGYTHGRDLAGCARLGALTAAEIIGHIGARPEASLRELMVKAGL